MRASEAENRHIVDVLIEERAPRLSRSFVWPLVRAVLKLLLNYRRARDMADAIKDLPGSAALQFVSDLLELDVRVAGLQNMPREGAAMIVCNHPTGIADGVAVYEALISSRPDLSFFANADAHRVSPGLIDVLIPVAWPQRKRTIRSTKQTLKLAKQAIANGRPVVVFPAGALSRKIAGKIQDPEWEHSAVALAKKYKIPVVPIHIDGPRPRLFHLFDRFSNELRDVTLFHELLNKRGQTYQLTIGPIIESAALIHPAEATTRRLKAYVEEQLPVSPEISFSDEDPGTASHNVRSAK